MEEALRHTKVMLLAIGLGVGGTEAHVLELASRIDRRRFDVVVGVLKGTGPIAQELQARGVRVVPLGGGGKLDPRVPARLWRLIRQERPTVLHAFLFWANLAARVIGRGLKVPLVLSSYHDMPGEEPWIYWPVDRLTRRLSHGMVCCSEAVGHAVRARLGGEAADYVTIPFGVDATRFQGEAGMKRAELGLQESLPVLGTVCRLVEPKKGLRVLLEALARLRGTSEAPPCQVLIVGDGPARNSLGQLVEELRLSKWVVFAGRRRDIPRLLPLMDLFVLPSRYEGFGIAILEAMAAGRPVIATAVGGILELVVSGASGLLVPPDDPVSLAAAIATLLANPDRAADLGREAQRRARERFSIDGIVRQHERLYAAWLQRSAASRAAQG